eukprot:SAG31_NODE_7207_length_1755_cov_1.482488_1_plen_157_part_00
MDPARMAASAGTQPTALESLRAAHGSAIRWVPWLRVGSAACLGGQHQHHLHAKERARVAELSRTKRRKIEAQLQPSSCAFRFAELFAGIGGFRLALEALDGQCVFASELEREVRDVYAANFDDVRAIYDLTAACLGSSRTLRWTRLNNAAIALVCR